MKKNLCILLLISLISTFCPAIQSNAESTAAIENVSTGKKATSSLNYYSETYNPSKVNDGNLSTFWHPSTLAEGVTHHWVMIDLGKAYQLSEIEIYDSGNDDEMHRQNLEFQASNDESFGSYVTLDSITSAEESAEKYIDYIWTINVTDTEKYRYVRLIRTDSRPWGPYIKEINVFAYMEDENSDSSIRTLKDVAVHKTATSSTAYYSEDHNPSKAVDDNISTFWHPAALDKTKDEYHWLKVDLGAAYQISQIKIYDYGNTQYSEHRANLKVEASNFEDFSYAITLDSIASQDETKYACGGVWTIDMSTKQKYRYIRVRKTNANEWCPYIREIEVYGYVTTEVVLPEGKLTNSGENGIQFIDVKYDTVSSTADECEKSIAIKDAAGNDVEFTAVHDTGMVRIPVRVLESDSKYTLYLDNGVDEPLKKEFTTGIIVEQKDVAYGVVAQSIEIDETECSVFDLKEGYDLDSVTVENAENASVYLTRSLDRALSEMTYVGTVSGSSAEYFIEGDLIGKYQYLVITEGGADISVKAFVGAESLKGRKARPMGGNVDFRFGAFSDVHNQSLTKNEKLDGVLSYIKNTNPDAVALVGDIVYWTPQVALDDTATMNGRYGVIMDTLNKYGVNNYKNDLTTGIPSIYVAGNHEFIQDDSKLYEADDEYAAGKSVFEDNVGYYHKHEVVNGYHLIGFSSNTGAKDDGDVDMGKWVIEQIEAAKADDTTGKKPIFVFGHIPTPASVFKKYITGNSYSGSANLIEYLKSEPRVIYISGHMHLPEQNPLSINQKGYTQLLLGVVDGGFLSSDNSVNNMSLGDALTNYHSQGFVIEVTLYPVGAIEIFAAREDSRRKSFAMYASNTDEFADLNDEAKAAKITAMAAEAPSALYTTENGYTKLTGLESNAVALDGYLSFPRMLWDSSKNGDDKSYLASVNDSEQYRYVTYKRTSMTNTELDEMRIMVINPVVNEITTDGNKVTVEFSDELAAASVTSEKISVTNGEEALGIQNLTVKDYSVSFEVEDAPEFGTCDITIARTVRNTKGVTMAADYNGSVAFGDGINVNSLKFDKEELTAGDTVTATADLISALTEEKTVILITAVKNTSTGELLSAKIDRQTIEAGGTLTLSADVTLPSSVDNISVEAFVWENKTMIPLYGKTIFGEGV